MNRTIQPIEPFGHKKPPPVPEVMDYGLIMISLCVMLIFFKRSIAYDKARQQKTGKPQ